MNLVFGKPYKYRRLITVMQHIGVTGSTRMHQPAAVSPYPPPRPLLRQKVIQGASLKLL